MNAAVFHAVKQPLTVEEIDVDRPGPDEILVRTAASGVCHSDLHYVEGLYPLDVPAVLGHEASGVVEAIGSNVAEFKPGDPVIACLSVFCGTCEQCLKDIKHSSLLPHSFDRQAQDDAKPLRQAQDNASPAGRGSAAGGLDDLYRGTTSIST